MAARRPIILAVIAALAAAAVMPLAAQAAVAPDPPTNVTAVAGNRSATVTWAAPANDGGDPISSYTVTSSPDGITATTPDGSTTTATVSPLTNGTTYTFTVTASNSIGPSLASAASNGVTPATTPGAPTSVGASAGSGSAQLTWTAPASDGGSAIINYTVTSSPDGKTASTSGSTSTTVNGLTNGTAYTFTVVATNGVGPGPASSPSNSVTPGTTPGAPTNVVATSTAPASADVSWGAPASNGGSAITGYVVTSSPGGKTASTNGATVATVPGLTNGTPYTFTVVASNRFGPGPASTPSNSVTPGTTPGAPTNVVATSPAPASASVSWAAPASNGGSAITGYVVTSSPDGKTASTNGATSATVSGLTNGTTYTFTVVASNKFGPGPASAPSNSVTPATTPGAPTNVVAQAGNASANVTWTAPASNGGSPILSYKVTSSPGGFTATTNGSTTSATVNGLSNGGTAYTFTVVATNGVGPGQASGPSNSVTPTANVPSAPTSVVATATGDGKASVSWTAPTSDGGSPITSYTVNSSPPVTIPPVTSGTSTTVTGLTNGTPYTFTVIANNIAGGSPPSAPSNSVTTIGASGAPTSVVAGPGDSSAGVRWTAPTSLGGSPITSYTVTSSPGGFTAKTLDGITTNAVVTGLANGTSYTFTVIATNSVGPSPASAPSSAVVPGPATVTSVFPKTCPWNGCVGVVVRGMNLFGATSVQFGTSAPVTPCITSVGGPCTIVDSAAITVDAPQGSGVVDVRVISGAPTNITPISSLDKFTYTTNCLSATVAPDVPSPQPVGTLVTFTTSPVGCPIPMFTYWLRYPNGTWVNVRPWSLSSIWRWPTGILGTYTLHVGVNESGDSLKTFEALAFMTFVVTKATAGSPCTAATLNPPAPLSPQQSGTIITFTATATPCLNPEFKFYVRATSGPWILGRNFGIGTYVWNTAGNGVTSYYVDVWVREKGSTAAYQAYQLISYTLNPPQACTVPTTLTPNPVSPQPTGAIVTFTGTASTCSQPLYKFYVKAIGGPWILGKNWGTNTYIWITKGNGRTTYNVVVWVRQNGSKAAQETYLLIPYTLS